MSFGIDLELSGLRVVAYFLEPHGIIDIDLRAFHYHVDGSHHRVAGVSGDDAVGAVLARGKVYSGEIPVDLYARRIFAVTVGEVDVIAVGQDESYILDEIFAFGMRLRGSDVMQHAAAAARPGAAYRGEVQEIVRVVEDYRLRRSHRRILLHSRRSVRLRIQVPVCDVAYRAELYAGIVDVYLEESVVLSGHQLERHRVRSVLIVGVIEVEIGRSEIFPLGVYGVVTGRNGHRFDAVLERITAHVREVVAYEFLRREAAAAYYRAYIDILFVIVLRGHPGHGAIDIVFVVEVSVNVPYVSLAYEIGHHNAVLVTLVTVIVDDDVGVDDIGVYPLVYHLLDSRVLLVIRSAVPVVQYGIRSERGTVGHVVVVAGKQHAGAVRFVRSSVQEEHYTVEQSIDRAVEHYLGVYGLIDEVEFAHVTFEKVAVVVGHGIGRNLSFVIGRRSVSCVDIDTGRGAVISYVGICVVVTDHVIALVEDAFVHDEILDVGGTLIDFHGNISAFGSYLRYSRHAVAMVDHGLVNAGLYVLIVGEVCALPIFGVIPKRRVYGLLLKRAAGEVLLEYHRVSRGKRQEMRNKPRCLIEHVDKDVYLIRYELDKVDYRGSGISEMGAERPEQDEVDKARNHARAGGIHGVHILRFLGEHVIVDIFFSRFAEYSGEVEFLDIVFVGTFGNVAEIRGGVTLIDGYRAVTAIREQQVIDESEHRIESVGRYPRFDIREGIARIRPAFLEAVDVIRPRNEYGLAPRVEILRSGVEAAGVAEQRADTSLGYLGHDGAADTAYRVGNGVRYRAGRLTLRGVDDGVKDAFAHCLEIFVLTARYAVLGVARVGGRLRVAHAGSVGNICSQTDTDALEKARSRILATSAYP